MGSDSTIDYLKGLSIEALLQTEITSVSKKAEHLFDVAAAITVLTQEDIARSGAHTIPELLRLVPGLQVAQLDSSRWAISSRGFNERFANKLLVMIDGRSVYSPLFSGVFWNAQDTMLEDIERIEIIRGPGATVWGANAVNGVINIITRHSRDTEGGSVAVTAGSHLRPLLAARYGGTVDDKTTYRLFAKGFSQENFKSLSGGPAHDSWNSIRAGFRADRDHSPHDTFSLQGEIYSSDAAMEVELPQPPTFVQELTDIDEEYSGGHLLATWEHSFSPSSTLDFQVYYDYTNREQLATETRDTIDFEIKHHWAPDTTHDIVWGIGYRWSHNEIEDKIYLSIDPDNNTDELFSAFIQDDIEVVDDTFWLTLGSKLEHNDYSGVEIQPSLRLRYKPDEKYLFWGAISRAVRTPSQAERNLRAFIGTDFTIIEPFATNIWIEGDEDFDSETLTAYEVGARWKPSEALSFDIALFYNEYEDIRIIEPETPTLISLSPPTFALPTVFTNGVDGSTYGFELQTTWQQSSIHTLSASYSFIKLDLESKAGITGASEHEGQAPTQQFQVRSHLLLTETLAMDTRLFYVDDIEGTVDMVDEYWRTDIQLGWQATNSMHLSGGVSNLFDSQHQEFPIGQLTYPSEIPRQFWVKATYSF